MTTPVTAAASVMNSPRCIAAQNVLHNLRHHAIRKPSHQHPSNNPGVAITARTQECLNERFIPMLRFVARSYRLSPIDVDDVVQTTWRRLHHVAPLREPAAAELRAVLGRAVATLPERYRQLMTLLAPSRRRTTRRSARRDDADRGYRTDTRLQHCDVFSSVSLLAAPFEQPLRASLGLLAAAGDLLDGPAVAVRIAEEDETDVVEWIGLRARALAQELDIADVDLSLGELGSRRVDVGDDQLQALERARRHVRDDAFAHHDRAARPGWRELHDPVALADRCVVVHTEAELFCVERLGTIHVGDGDDDDFKRPVHVLFLAW
jgi:hypothetical protein